MSKWLRDPEPGDYIKCSYYRRQWPREQWITTVITTLFLKRDARFEFLPTEKYVQCPRCGTMVRQEAETICYVCLEIIGGKS